MESPYNGISINGEPPHPNAWYCDVCGRYFDIRDAGHLNFGRHVCYDCTEMDRRAPAQIMIWGTSPRTLLCDHCGKTILRGTRNAVLESGATVCGGCIKLLGIQ